MWAPSMKEMMPAFLARDMSSSTGKRIAVGEVKWLMNIILVLGVTLLQMMSTSSSWEGEGIGI